MSPETPKPQPEESGRKIDYQKPYRQTLPVQHPVDEDTVWNLGSDLFPDHPTADAQSQEEE